MYVHSGHFRLRQISKIKKYDAIDKKYVRGRGWFTRKNAESFPKIEKVSRGQKNRTKRDADDDERG